MSRISFWVRGGLLLAAGLLLVSCSSSFREGGSSQVGQDTGDQKKANVKQTAPAGFDDNRPRASAGLVGMGFKPTRGLREKTTGKMPSFEVIKGSDSVVGSVYFSTTGQVFRSHFTALLNFVPMDILLDQNGAKSSVISLDPVDRGKTRLDVNIPVKALVPGTNCLVFIVQEDYEKRMTLRLRPITIGLRVDIHNGSNDGAEGCPEPTNESKISILPDKESTGLFEPVLSTNAKRINLAQRVKWQDLQQGRLYAHYSGLAGYGSQESIVLLMADGQILSFGGHPLLSKVRLEEDKGIIASFPIPKPSKPMAVVAGYVPLTDRTIDSNKGAPLAMMPKFSWQMLISP